MDTEAKKIGLHAIDYEPDSQLDTVGLESIAGCCLGLIFLGPINLSFHFANSLVCLQRQSKTNYSGTDYFSSIVHIH